MRRLRLFVAAAAAGLLGVALSCNGRGGADTPLFIVTTDSSAAEQGARMAATLAPEDAARSVAAWMEGARLADAAFAHELYGSLRAGYDSAGAARLDAALDSIHRSLPARAQAIMLALSASPERVAAALAADTSAMAAALIPEMERVYSSDSLMAARFRRSLTRRQTP